MTRKAILYDLDGTLVHTSPDYAERCFTEAMGRFSITLTQAQCYSLWFRGDRNEQIHGLGLDPLAFWEVFRHIDTIEERIRHTRPYDDIGTLFQLRDAGYLQAVVTNAPPYTMDGEVPLTRFDFDACVSASDVTGIPGKPSPAGLLECLRRLDVKPADAWYVGNGEEDVLAAKAAGVRDVFLDRREYANGHVDASVRIYGLDELEALVATHEAQSF